MKKNLEIIETEIIKLQYKFIEETIKEIWNKDSDDYGIEIVNMDLIEFSNYYINFGDFKDIATYEISESICYEFWDDSHLTFETERMKKFKEYCIEIGASNNLAFFNRYCNNLINNN